MDGESRQVQATSSTDAQLGAVCGIMCVAPIIGIIAIVMVARRVRKAKKVKEEKKV